MKKIFYYLVPSLWLLVNLPIPSWNWQSLITHFFLKADITTHVLYSGVSIMILFGMGIFKKDHGEPAHFPFVAGILVVMITSVKIAQFISSTYAHQGSFVVALLYTLVPLGVIALLIAILFDWIYKR